MCCWKIVRAISKFCFGTVTVLAFVLEDDSGTKMIQKEIMPLMVMDKVRHTVMYCIYRYILFVYVTSTRVTRIGIELGLLSFEDDLQRDIYELCMYLLKSASTYVPYMYVCTWYRTACETFQWKQAIHKTERVVTK